ncbi:MAG: RiPP maturation radical SAM protein 1 [Desulfobulbaceae bacterium]|uniref:RiPP maturation radical SAM protein 1 n=1 Tax=Candidatus Desulfatifera sulfidica TaxID=2841691 RepID=A0A8J6NA94_9BACT|nr:RiPP maturation radical SAM protein 1 [Candidatus Desulfatifera sulfidica]
MMPPSNPALRVALISLPWAIFNRPSIQLGALKAFLEQDPQIRCDTFHPYLLTAKALGTAGYHELAENSWAGEALFSPLLFPEHHPAAARLFHKSWSGSSKPPFDFTTTVKLLDQVLHDWLADMNFSQYQLVGFSICFNQLLSSLVVASRLKNRHPELPIVFGGSGCVGPMGHSLLQTFPQIDYIVHGEGEQNLKRICEYLLHKKNLLPPQVYHRHKLRPGEPVPPIQDLNQLPTPDYRPYFKEMEQIFPGQPFIPILPVEFSRGCWWNRCTFCNLNLQWHGYRWKKSTRMCSEVQTLSQTHQALDFTFTDNALPPNEADRFFKTISETQVDLDFFAEIRVIPDPKRLALYHRGGLSTVQVGIEALSSSLLKRMDKGTTTIENIAAMKAAQACGMRLEGNLILEFPGSSEEEAHETLTNLDFVLPYLPLTGASFFLGHGSPVQQNPSHFGITAITRHPKNKQLLPAPCLSSLTMLIKGYRGDRTIQQKRWLAVNRKIKDWQGFHKRRRNIKQPALSQRDGGSFLIIRQEQDQGPTLQHRLQGRSREIYLFCATICERSTLHQQYPMIPPDRIDMFLNELTTKRLLFQEKDTVLALAVSEPGKTTDSPG